MDAEDRAWDRARRRQPCLLASNQPLRDFVAEKLAEDWSPEQISGHLARVYAAGSGMRVSHETIYKSLFVQARGVLATRVPRNSELIEPRHTYWPAASPLRVLQAVSLGLDVLAGQGRS